MQVEQSYEPEPHPDAIMDSPLKSQYFKGGEGCSKVDTGRHVRFESPKHVRRKQEISTQISFDDVSKDLTLQPPKNALSRNSTALIENEHEDD